MMELKLDSDQLELLLQKMGGEWGEDTLEIFRLYYVEGKSQKEITDALGKSKGFVSQRVKKFEDKLIKVLDDNGLKITSVIHTEANTGELKKLDITREEDK